jgi:hypothetical protein
MTLRLIWQQPARTPYYLNQWGQASRAWTTQDELELIKSTLEAGKMLDALPVFAGACCDPSTCLHCMQKAELKARLAELEARKPFLKVVR